MKFENDNLKCEKKRKLKKKEDNVKTYIGIRQFCWHCTCFIPNRNVATFHENYKTCHHSNSVIITQTAKCPCCIRELQSSKSKNRRGYKFNNPRGNG